MKLIDLYDFIKKSVIDSGFFQEIEWCKNQEWYKEGLCHGDVLIELLQLQ